jgi:hypothetical protein
MERRDAPNVLVILFDKCLRDAIGAYGLKDVHTSQHRSPGAVWCAVLVLLHAPITVWPGASFDPYGQTPARTRVTEKRLPPYRMGGASQRL